MQKNIIQVFHENNVFDCPNKVLESIKSWEHNNPEWEHLYISFNDAKKIIFKHLGKDGIKAFAKMQTKSEKSDLIRYCCLYEFGGVYADTDTFCNIQIEKWFDTSFDTCVGSGNGFILDSGVVGSKQGNAVMKNIFEDIVEKILSDKYNNLPQFAYGSGGPYALTRNIMNFYDIQDGFIFNDYTFTKNDSVLRIVGQADLQGGKFVKHIYGSVEWNIENYEQWSEIKNNKSEYLDLNQKDIFYKFWRYV